MNDPTLAPNEDNQIDDGTSDSKVLARAGESETFRKALLSRPYFSVRFQLLLGFLLTFLFAVGIAFLIIKDINELENKSKGLEIVNDYVIAIDQARRFEKNFFLYKTNLNDALESVYNSKVILESNQEDLTSVIDNRQYQEIFSNVLNYEGLLEELIALVRDSSTTVKVKNLQTMETRIRKQGQQMVSLAQDLLDKEKKSVKETFSRSRRTQVYSLVFLLLIMVIMVYLLGSNILAHILRFEKYALRIAEGNYELIQPARKYRDEFTNLAIAINYMITELEKHQVMLVQSHKMRAIGTLTAGVAHELNNPLNNIILTTFALLEDYMTLSDKDRKEMIEEIGRESDRAMKIVANLLDFTRESGTSLEPLDLVQLVKNTMDLASNQLKIAGVKIVFHASDNLHRIQGDSQQLSQVILNLILNAIAASPKNGKIQIIVNPADKPEHIAVKIIDEGTGIPKHFINRIFDPFFTTKERGKGSGLGLSVSQGIIAKHGGSIHVDSSEGKGSVFTVVLPVTTIL